MNVRKSMQSLLGESSGDEKAQAELAAYLDKLAKQVESARAELKAGKRGTAVAQVVSTLVRADGEPWYRALYK